MEELLVLKEYIEQQKYADAMELISEMEEMSKEDKINKIRSFAKILLSHLIKQTAEKRTTRSWDYSIRNASEEIAEINKRRRAGGTYLTGEELVEIIHRTYPRAIELASLEVFEGKYDEKELDEKVNRKEIEEKAFNIILEWLKDIDK
jgi:hypothetical protein